MITEALVRVRERISQACRRSSRDPAEITLVAVSKGRSIEEIRQAADAGVAVIGENRVQEALRHRQQLSAQGRAVSVSWHMVGHLQTNKCREAVGFFDLIHSVDSLRLAEALDKAARSAGKVQDILIEVNTSGETSKFGLAPAEAAQAIDGITDLPNLNLCGLMTLAPLSDDPESARPYFAALRRIRDEARSRGSGKLSALRELSMGMSDDFEVAIEEGATMIRLGRAIFQP